MLNKLLLKLFGRRFVDYYISIYEEDFEISAAAKNLSGSFKGLDDDDIKKFLLSLMRQDRVLYWNAQTDDQRAMIRGAFQRTFYLKNLLDEKKDDKERRRDLEGLMGARRG